MIATTMMDHISILLAATLLFFALVGFVTFVVVSGLKQDKNGSWHSHMTLFRVPCIDGVNRSGALMRRWAGGAWQYRKETDQEGMDRLGP